MLCNGMNALFLDLLVFCIFKIILKVSVLLSHFIELFNSNYQIEWYRIALGDARNNDSLDL